jgi:glycosyltransferase involved in cell wall biosynthesis
MPPRRIVHVINSIGLGGVPESAYHLMKALPPGAFDLQLYVLKPPPDGDAVRRERLRRFEDLGMPIAFGAPREHKLAAVSDLVSYLGASDPRSSTRIPYKPNLYGRLAAGLYRDDGLLTLAHYHNEYDAAWERDGSLPLDRALTKGTDAVVACSHVVASHVGERLGLGAGDVCVVPNGVDCAHFRPVRTKAAARASLGLPQEPRLIGIVGRISAQKGQEDVVAALPGVIERCPDAMLVLAGAPDEQASLDRLVQQIASLGLTDRVVLLGYVTDVSAVYTALDVLAAPSRWEGFGLMLVEAMAAGLPIVATRAGAIPEVVGDVGAALLVGAADPETVAQALVAVLDDPRRADAMGQAGLQRSQHYDWSRSSAILAGLYERMLSGAGTR